MSEEHQDQRYDEAAIEKMAALWAQMYHAMVERGIPPHLAIKVVRTWIRTTLVK